MSCVQILGADKDYVLGDIGTGGMAGGGATAGDGGVAGQGGMAEGGMAAGGGATCGEAPAPPGGNCPNVCNGGCDGDVCVIDCGAQDCGVGITCPPNFACEVRCTAALSCRDANIQCPEIHACNVVCDGSLACRDATLTCGDDPCDLTCGSGCSGMAVACGADACTATCGGSEVPTLDCAASCMCEGC